MFSGLCSVFLPTGAVRLPDAAKLVKALRPKKRKPMDAVVSRLGIDIKQEKPSLLHHSKPTREPLRPAFPRPAVITMPTKNYDNSEPAVTPGQPSIMKKRGYEQANGIDDALQKLGDCFYFNVFSPRILEDPLLMAIIELFERKEIPFYKTII